MFWIKSYIPLWEHPQAAHILPVTPHIQEPLCIIESLLPLSAHYTVTYSETNDLFL